VTNKLITQLNLDIKNRPHFMFNVVLSSVFFTLLLILPFYDAFLEIRWSIRDFSNHAMSAASAVDLNIASRINSYFLLLFGVLALVIIFFVSFYAGFSNYYKSGIDEEVKVL